MASKEIIKNIIVKLEDDLQHYTMVDIDRAKAKYIELELEDYKQVLKDLERLEAFDNLNKTIEARVLNEFNLPYDYFEVKRENEKIKDELASIKKYVTNKIDYLEHGIFLTDSKLIEGAISILKQLLKEAFGNGK